MYHSFLIHSSADGHLRCFHVLAMINSAAMNTGVHVSLSDLVSLLCMRRSGIAGSYGSSISSFLRNLHPVQLSVSFFNNIHRQTVRRSHLQLNLKISSTFFSILTLPVTLFPYFFSHRTYYLLYNFFIAYLQPPEYKVHVDSDFLSILFTYVSPVPSTVMACKSFY